MRGNMPPVCLKTLQEEMKQGEHLPGKPGELLLAPGISPLLLVPDDVGAGGDLLLEQWQSQAMVETNQMKLRKGHPARPRALP